MIILPAQKKHAIDQMDEGMDILRTVWCALHARQNLAEAEMDALANTLNTAILVLEPVREAINVAHGESAI